MMKQLIAASLLVTANVAFAGLEEIRTLIQEKMMMDTEINVANQDLETVQISADAIVCPANGSTLFCPLTNVPGAIFPPEGGFLTSTSSQPCCPAKYLQCQVQQQQQYCRYLMYYTLQDQTANSEDICPPTTPNCVCQQSLVGGKGLTLRFCPKQVPCCPNCECHGDPHCRSFKEQIAVWATCDDRDASCLHSPTTCVNAKYNGKQCEWHQKPGTAGYCSRADGTADPQMLMYQKKYKSYFNPADNTEYEFKLLLWLGTYGSISKIQMWDTQKSANPYVWSITADGDCRGNAAYPINGQGKVFINDLPSMVKMNFQCFSKEGRSPTSARFDIPLVEDPWFIGDKPISSSFTGFCATGQIAESAGEVAIGGCSIVDRQLVKHFGCTSTTDLTICKNTWCSNNFKKFIFPKGTTNNACRSFVNDKVNVKNYLAAVCAQSNLVTKGAPGPYTAVDCEDRKECKACMDNILDYPEEIASILAGNNDVIPTPPLKSCPDDIVLEGLSRKQLVPTASGVQIDYQAPNTVTWTPVFALLESELYGCDCRNLPVNGTDDKFKALVNPGTYRIKQCAGLDTDPEQEMCLSSPSYNATVTYTNAFQGAIVSTPFGVLWGENAISCSKSKYPACPTEFVCCQWKDSEAGWNQCMAENYPNHKVTHPNCKFA